MVEEIVGYLSGGLQGVKVGFGKKGDAHLGFDHERDVDYVRSVREAIGDKRLMIDLGVKNRWDIATAIQRARAFEEYRVHWLEEPLGHDDPEGYRALRAGTSLRIGYGEREWSHRGVQRIVETGTVDVIGLDPGRIEGITGFRKAAEICAQYRRQANAHNFSTAIVSAASQALSFASLACRELELQPVYGPAQKDLVDRPVWHRDGWVVPPQGGSASRSTRTSCSARLDHDALSHGASKAVGIVTGGAAPSAAPSARLRGGGARSPSWTSTGACDRTAGLGRGTGLRANLRDIPRSPRLVARIEDRWASHRPRNVARIILRNPDLLASERNGTPKQREPQGAVLPLPGLRRSSHRHLHARKHCQLLLARMDVRGLRGLGRLQRDQGAVTTMTRGMARSWAPHGIRVNGVAPGLVETPMLVTPQTTPEQIAAIEAQIPLGRLGQPADHVGVTVFLSSDMAAYMTGAMVNVSGGFLMY
jgi:hypothetical protein